MERGDSADNDGGWRCPREIGELSKEPSGNMLIASRGSLDNRYGRVGW